MSPFSLHMECYDSAEWQANFYHGPCGPCTIRSNDDDPDLPGLDAELAQAREDYLACMLLAKQLIARAFVEANTTLPFWKLEINIINKTSAT